MVAARHGEPVKALFVCYGAGHVEMCLPVLRALRRAQPGCETVLLALTTAFSAARAAGESPIGYRDLIAGADGERALAYGRELLAGQRQHPQVAPEESAAYLGLNFLEWVDAHGEAAARKRWDESGRQGFLPVQLFAGLLRRITPDVVVTTNSPRSEQAAIEAASALGIPSLSMVDLFALPGDPFLQRRLHASRITVLAEATRVNLIAAGVEAQRVVVTGNPAFDALTSPDALALGQRWRDAKGWTGRHVVLWAGYKEAADCAPKAWSGTGFGQAVQQRLVDWTLADDDRCLVVRYHPNEWHEFPPLPVHPRLHWSRPDQEPLQDVLMGADQLVVQASTVGAQAFAARKPVVCLRFSPHVRQSGFDYFALGMAQGAQDFDDMVRLLDRGIETGALPRPEVRSRPAAESVAGIILALGQTGVA